MHTHPGRAAFSLSTAAGGKDSKTTLRHSIEGVLRAMQPRGVDRLYCGNETQQTAETQAEDSEMIVIDRG
jgi:hypothetical protein